MERPCETWTTWVTASDLDLGEPVSSFFTTDTAALREMLSGHVFFASSRAKGMEAAEVLPYSSRLQMIFS